jgi:hypothetical protein
MRLAPAKAHFETGTAGVQTSVRETGQKTGNWAVWRDICSTYAEHLQLAK